MVDILGRDVIDLARAPDRLDEAAEHRALIRSAACGELGSVLRQVPLDEVAHGWRGAGLGPYAERVASLVDFPLKPFRLLPRGCHRPVRPGADRETALARSYAIGEHERARTSRGDADAEARDLPVVDNDVLRPRFEAFHAAFGEVCFHARSLADHSATVGGGQQSALAMPRDGRRKRAKWGGKY